MVRIVGMTPGARLGVDVSAGKMLVVAGLGLVGLGLLVIVGGRLGFGRLPGDFVYRSGGTTVYAPLATCLLLSLAFSLVMWLVRAFRG